MSKEILIEEPAQLLEIIKGSDLEEDEDIGLLINLVEARSDCCCRSSRDQADKGIIAIYKKIIYDRLNSLRKPLLEIAAETSHSSVRFKGGFRASRRKIDPYDILIQNEHL